MFKLIEKLSAFIAQKISDTDENNDNFDYYEYSIHGYISFFLYCSIAIILSLLFGYFTYVFLIIFVLLNIRSQSGGSHALSNKYCLLATSFWYLVIGLSVQYLSNLYFLFFLLSLIAFTGLKEVPKYTNTAKHHSTENQKKFKKKYIIRISLVAIVNLVFIIFAHCDINVPIFEFSKLSMVLSMCYIVNRFSLSNLSFVIFEKLG